MWFTFLFQFSVGKLPEHLVILLHLCFYRMDLSSYNWLVLISSQSTDPANVQTYCIVFYHVAIANKTTFNVSFFKIVYKFDCKVLMHPLKGNSIACTMYSSKGLIQNWLITNQSYWYFIIIKRITTIGFFVLDNNILLISRQYKLYNDLCQCELKIKIRFLNLILHHSVGVLSNDAIHLEGMLSQWRFQS